jgi:hypothetical protein
VYVAAGKRGSLFSSDFSTNCILRKTYGAKQTEAENNIDFCLHFSDSKYINI